MIRPAALAQGGLARVLAGALLLYAILALVMDAPTLILLLNGIAMSASAGVCVAYAPVLGTAMLARSPSRGDLLAAGIWFISLSVFGQRGLSYVARDLALPEVYNTDWLTLVLFHAIVGHLLHLWAPGAAAGRMPKRRWVTGGAVVALGIFAAFLIAIAHHRVGAAPPVRLR